MFHNYIKAQREIFGVRVECDRRLELDREIVGYTFTLRRYHYRIVDEPDGSGEQRNIPVLWAMESLVTAKALRKDYVRAQNDWETSTKVLKSMKDPRVLEELGKYVYIDCRSTGAELVDKLFGAIYRHRYVHLKPGFDGSIRFVLFKPMGLVMKDCVWYLLGYTVDNVGKVVPLRRISDLYVTNTEFEPDVKFSPEKFWKENRHGMLEMMDLEESAVNSL